VLSANQWGPAEDEVLKIMRDKPGDLKKRLKDAISRVQDVNLFHDWRDADFSLLFHASLEDCQEAVKYLLEKGADPTKVSWLHFRAVSQMILFMSN
jgi:hypothetical protein